MEESVTHAMTPADQTIVSRHREMITGVKRIRLTVTEDPAGRHMAEFCDQLEALLPAVKVVKEPAEDDPPAIHVTDNIHFQMAPSGKLLELFLFSLMGNDVLVSQDLGADAEETGRRIELPAIFKIYTAHSCPHCPNAVARGLFLAGAAPSKVDLRVIDGQMFAEKAAADGVRSVPATILDDRFRWSGVFSLPEVTDMIVNRDPAQLGTDTLKKMISDGDAEGVARLMNDFDKVIPGFTALLTHEKWTVRLGAMVAFEYLAETNAALARAVLEQLWPHFDHYEQAVQGDMLHLYGVLGQRDMIARLDAVADGAYADAIRNVAREVMEALHEDG